MKSALEAIHAAAREQLAKAADLKDLEELDPLVRAEVTFTPVSTVAEVLDIALVRPEKPEATSELPTAEQAKPIAAEPCAILPGNTQPDTHYTTL